MIKHIFFTLIDLEQSIIIHLHWQRHTHMLANTVQYNKRSVRQLGNKSARNLVQLGGGQLPSNDQ